MARPRLYLTGILLAVLITGGFASQDPARVVQLGTAVAAAISTPSSQMPTPGADPTAPAVADTGPRQEHFPPTAAPIVVATPNPAPGTASTPRASSPRIAQLRVKIADAPVYLVGANGALYVARRLALGFSEPIVSLVTVQGRRFWMLWEGYLPEEAGEVVYA